MVGDDIRGVEVANGCKHSVDVYDDGDKTEEEDNKTVGTVVGDDIRGVQLAGGCKHTVDVCDDGEKLGEWLERRTETISLVFSSHDVANTFATCKHVCVTMWVFVMMGTRLGEWMMGHLERWTVSISGEFKPPRMLMVVYYNG